MLRQAGSESKLYNFFILTFLNWSFETNYPDQSKKGNKLTELVPNQMLDSNYNKYIYPALNDDQIYIHLR